MASGLFEDALSGNRAAIAKLLDGHAESVRAMAVRDPACPSSLAEVGQLVTRVLREAESEFDSFTGTTERELVEWLQRVLEGCIASASSRESDRVRLAIATLPTVQGQVVRLHQVYGWQVVRIADHLGLDEVTVAGLLRRGLRRLRQVIEPEEQDGHE